MPEKALTRTSFASTFVLFSALSCGESEERAIPRDPIAQSNEDWIELPPPREEVSSPGGGYAFTLTVTEKRSRGELFRIVDGQRDLLFSRELPHEYRPRFAAVSDGGRVLLLDEWINVASRHAVMVLDSENRIVAEHDFYAVADALDLPGSEIVAQARLGSWLQSAPRIEPGAEIASVRSAGKTLVIDLGDGTLRVEQ